MGRRDGSLFVHLQGALVVRRIGASPFRVARLAPLDGASEPAYDLTRAVRRAITVGPLVTQVRGVRMDRSAVRNPSIRAKWIWCAVAVWFAQLPATAFAQSPCPGIHVDVPNIANNKGGVACALFSAEEGFPHQFMRFAERIVMTKVRGEEAGCDFVDVKPGTYALAVIHDENLNGELDTNALGAPSEGYGFSSGAEAVLSAPSFSDADFRYGGQRMDLTITLDY